MADEDYPMADEVEQPLVMPDPRIHAYCCRLVSNIRFREGCRNECINNFNFARGYEFGLIERRIVVNDNETPEFRHIANFALVLMEDSFAGGAGVPELRSPIFSIDGCGRQWQVVANFIKGRRLINDQIDLYLKCLDLQNGASIRAVIGADLYRGMEKIVDERTTDVSFDSMHSIHTIYKLTRRRRRVDDMENRDRFADAYTIVGSLSFNDCCGEVQSD